MKNSKISLEYLLMFLQCASIFKTLYVNFRTLPFSQAMRLPILVGKRVQLIGLRKGSIEVCDKRPTLFSIQLGVSNQYSIFAPKGEHSMMRFSESGKLIFGYGGGKKITYVRIKNGFNMSVKGIVRIEDDVFINQRFTMICSKSVTIKEHVGIGWNSLIMDTDLHYVYDQEYKCIHNSERPVVIENYVWIANSCSIMKGTVLPKFSMVASGSLVNKDFSTIETEGNFFAGRPAKLKRTGLYRVFNREKQSDMESLFRQQQTETMSIPEEKGRELYQLGFV